MKKFGIGCVVASFVLTSSAAYGADPVTAGSANIGKHPSYGSSYVGYWKTGADYSLLTNGSSTFLNVPASDGSLYFRVRNSTNAYMDQSNFVFYTPVTVASSVTVNDDLHTYGATTLDGGMMVFPSIPENWTTVIGGQSYGLSTTGSTLALDVQGPTFANGAVSINSTLTVASGITLNGGSARKPGGGSWLATSDFRVKKDVVDFEEGLAELEKVRSVRFRYNGLGDTEASEQQHIGVVAQELEETAPYMVSSRKHKLRASDAQAADIKEVDPSAFTYLLVNAVQELSAQNKAMKELVCQDHPKSDLCRGKLKNRRPGSRFAGR